MAQGSCNDPKSASLEALAVLILLVLHLALLANLVRGSVTYYSYYTSSYKYGKARMAPDFRARTKNKENKHLAWHLEHGKCYPGAFVLQDKDPPCSCLSLPFQCSDCDKVSVNRTIQCGNRSVWQCAELKGLKIQM